MWQTGNSLQTFRYWQACHNSWIILQFQKSSAVRLHIIPPEFNSDPNFSDTLTTLSVLTQLRFLSKEKKHILRTNRPDDIFSARLNFLNT